MFHLSCSYAPWAMGRGLLIGIACGDDYVVIGALGASLPTAAKAARSASERSERLKNAAQRTD